MSLSLIFGAASGFLFELATHVAIHYTVPGAYAAFSVAQAAAPFLDAIGLTSVFSASAGEAAIASLSQGSSLMGVPGIGS